MIPSNVQFIDEDTEKIIGTYATSIVPFPGAYVIIAGIRYRAAMVDFAYSGATCGAQVRLRRTT